MKERIFLEKDRIPVFIGKEGSNKRLLEKKFNCEIDVNSNNGEVLIETEDSVAKFVLTNVIEAINMGHNPENALKLEDENYVIDSIDIRNLIRNHDRLKIVMGRIIGKDGSTRKLIEEITKCNVAIKENFVTIVGPYENSILVHEAVTMLAKGASHKSFYSYLERNKDVQATGFL